MSACLVIDGGMAGLMYDDRVETAVKQILCGMNVKTSASVANAECLDWYRNWAQTHN